MNTLKHLAAIAFLTAILSIIGLAMVATANEQSHVELSDAGNSHSSIMGD